MKKVGDLFAELGFRAEGSDSVKRAFIENLMKAAGQTPAPNRAILEKGEQLSFDFSNGANPTAQLTTKKSAG